MKKVVEFRIDGGSFKIRMENARELAKRLKRMSAGTLSPAGTAAIRIEQVIEEEIAPGQTPVWLGEEKARLREALNEWLDQVGVNDFPEDVMALRYALHGEAQDEPA